jgi:alkylhydroperoxidase family enzyme
VPRITRLDRAQLDAESQAIAHRPEIFRTMIAHFRAVMETGTVPKKLKELAVVRTSQLNSCEY